MSGVADLYSERKRQIAKMMKEVLRHFYYPHSSRRRQRSNQRQTFGKFLSVSLSMRHMGIIQLQATRILVTYRRSNYALL